MTGVTEGLGTEIHVIFTIDAPPAEHASITSAAGGHDEEDDTVTALAGGKSLWTARVSSRSLVRPGQPVELAIDTSQLHFFDPATGDSIGHPLSAWPPPGPPAGTESKTQTRVDIGELLDLATPWCLLVAATLRIPAHIAAGRRDIGDLAAAAGCDRGALHAVLGHLVAKGVFTEDPPGRFAGNAAAARLAEDPFLDLEGIGGRMAHTWSTLLGYVRTGQPGYAGVFGRPTGENGGVRVA